MFEFSNKRTHTFNNFLCEIKNIQNTSQEAYVTYGLAYLMASLTRIYMVGHPKIKARFEFAAI